MPYRCSCGYETDNGKAFAGHLGRRDRLAHHKIGWVDPESGEVLDSRPRRDRPSCSAGSAGIVDMAPGDKYLVTLRIEVVSLRMEKKDLDFLKAVPQRNPGQEAEKEPDPFNEALKEANVLLAKSVVQMAKGTVVNELSAWHEEAEAAKPVTHVPQ